MNERKTDMFGRTKKEASLSDIAGSLSFLNMWMFFLLFVLTITLGVIAGELGEIAQALETLAQ